MPIKNLTDKRESGMPLAGRLYKGGPKQNGAFGKELDHFRYTNPHRKDDPTMAVTKDESDFLESYGKEPRFLNVYLPHQDVDQNFPTWYEIHSAGRLLYRGDGETATFWYDEKTKKYRSDPVPFPLEMKDEKGRPLARATGTLHLYLPDMWNKGHVGLVVLSTHSKNDIIRIHRALSAYQEARGDLRGIAFTLFRYLGTVTDPDGARRKKWLVGIRPEQDWAMAQLAAARATAYAELPLSSGTSLALPEWSTGGLEDTDDTEDFDDDTQVIDHDTGEIITPPVKVQAPTPAPNRPVPPPAKKTAVATKVTEKTDTGKANRFHQLGTWLYGKQWDKARKAIVGYVSGKKKTSSKDLTPDEMSKAVDELEAKWKRIAVIEDSAYDAMAKHIRKQTPVGASDAELLAWIKDSQFVAGNDPREVIGFLMGINTADPNQNNRDSVISGIDTVVLLAESNDEAVEGEVEF